MKHNLKSMNIVAQDQLVSVKGHKVSYIDEGVGLLPLVFIHGFPFDKSSWRFQVDALKEITRVISYDLRGFGKSEWDARPFSIDLFADDLVAFLDALGIKKSVICGMSMGGYIALNALQRFPERFEAAVLSNTQCIADSKEAREKRYASIASINEGGKADFAEGFVKKIFAEKTILDKSEIVAEIQDIILATSGQALVNTLQALADRKETCSILKNIEVPILVLSGSEDQVIPEAQAVHLNNEITVSSFHVIEGVGHMAQMEAPEVFNRYIAEFLGKFKLLQKEV